METIHLTLFLMLVLPDAGHICKHYQLWIDCRSYLSMSDIKCVGVHRSSSEILKRQKRNVKFSIDEGREDFPYTLGKVIIEKEVSLFTIHGQGVDEEPKGILQINENTGELTVHGPVDYEKYRVLKLNYQAFDGKNEKIRGQVDVDISILDANDNPPKFKHKIYEITISEFTSQGKTLITITASDDDTDESNRLFDLKIISVTPRPSELEFYMTQEIQTGTISFKGCLDHQKAEKYIIGVEARDRGEKIQLSSSCTVIVNIEDENNHLPQIIGQTGPGRVKEREENVLVARLQVTDEDSKGTAAWRAKYQIQGDPNNNFRITTDPVTNEGQLYVQKHLLCTDGPLRNLIITVENEISYRLCRVVSRSTTALWQVAITDDSKGTRTAHKSTRQVTVTVVDVNEPPYFDTNNIQIRVVENVKVGWYLHTFTAKDPDVISGNKIIYRTGDDPAGWITVDTKTGKITTTKIIDRESSFVTNNIYIVTILAVDNGQPPMTGTATLTVHITDENDNRPTLPEIVIVCQSDGLSRANIIAKDLDEDPYSGPFTFKLLGNVKGKWKLDRVQGQSVSLVKENIVKSGHYKLLLEVSDLGGKTAEHNLSVIVCNCKDPARPKCLNYLEERAFVIIFFSMLLLAGVLLLACKVSCKKESRPVLIPDDNLGQCLVNSNIEKPGTDCKLALNKENNQSQTQDHITSEVTTIKQSMGASSAMGRRHQHRHFKHRTWAGQRRYQVRGVRRTMLLKRLNETLYTLQAPVEELGDYAPHVYAEEGDSETISELDAISMSDSPFDQELDLDLDYRFNTLASVCMPSEGTTYRTTRFKTATLIKKRYSL